MASWFGFKPATVVPPPPPQPPFPSGQDGGDAPNKPQGDVGTRSAYTFDSTALERAAKAAKELERFPNAREALELSRMQELSRQKEIEQQTKQIEAQILAMKSDHSKIAEEERRKTIAEQAKHDRARADYQDQLARKRTDDELAMKAKMQEDALVKQENSVKRQEALRKATIEHELELKHKYDLEKVQAETAARAKAARDNRDVNLEMMRASEEEHRRTQLEKLRASGELLGTGLKTFLADKTQVTTTVAGLSFLAVGWFVARRATGVAAHYVQARIGRPALVRETSRLTPAEVFRHPLSAAKKVFSRSSADPLQGVVFSPNLERRVRDLAITTKNTRRNNGLFRNVLFYGPPGTGKTLFAKRLALHSGLDYAVLTGGDIAPLGRHAVSQIHALFDWAQTSRKGLIVFMDEADAFLQKRSKSDMSEELRAALNAFLYRTGEQSRRYMLVVASNQPELFDWAVADRIDQMVEIPLPGLEERERLLLHYFFIHIVEPATSGRRSQRLKLDTTFEWEKKCADVAGQTDGMSGRELAKLVVSWQAAAYASESGVLTAEMIDAVTADTRRQHAHKMQWLDERQTTARREGFDVRDLPQKKVDEPKKAQGGGGGSGGSPV